jgi:hypothetical protein
MTTRRRIRVERDGTYTRRLRGSEGLCTKSAVSALLSDTFETDAIDKADDFLGKAPHALASASPSRRYV